MTAISCSPSTRQALSANQITVEVSRLHSSYERGCQEKTLLHSPPGDLDRCLHPGPFLFVEGLLVLTLGAPHRVRQECGSQLLSPLSGFMQRSRHHSLRSCASQPLA